jgi:CMP-N,N'-diacetyllegionaminic acid synthase
MRILAVIPARGGSRRIKKKNIKNFLGKPLIYWTISIAKSCSSLNKVIVSTDSVEIAKTALKYGCEVPFMRPKNLAKDNTPGILPAIHASMIFPEYDWVMLLQPTSPLRSKSDILEVIKIAKKYKNKSIISVSKSLSHPEWIFTIDKKKLMKPIIKKKINHQSQNLQNFYTINGSIYLIKSDVLKKSKSFIQKDTIPYIMPISRSIDIDNQLDWIMAEYFANLNFK